MDPKLEGERRKREEMTRPIKDAENKRGGEVGGGRVLSEKNTPQGENGGKNEPTSPMGKGRLRWKGRTGGTAHADCRKTALLPVKGEYIQKKGGVLPL